MPIGDKGRFLVLMIPVATATWVGGFGPGMVALILSSLVGASLLPPKYSLAVSSPSDVISLVLYIVVSLVLIAIIERLRRAKDALAKSEAEIRTLNESLNNSLNVKEGALRRQQQFTSDASHELKTPLTAIRARTGIALSNPADPDELIEHLVAINRTADVMGSVVKDLLLLAASDEGQLQLRREVISARMLIDDALASVDISRHIVSISIDQDFDINCDPSAITRALVNVLQNALAHTPEGGRIHVSSMEENGMARFTVKDEGCGIPAEHLGRIFDRFHRVETSRDRKSGGSGLGLAIAKAIIEAHSGAIVLDSEIGFGTTAVLAIPTS